MWQARWHTKTPWLFSWRVKCRIQTKGDTAPKAWSSCLTSLPTPCSSSSLHPTSSDHTGEHVCLLCPFMLVTPCWSALHGEWIISQVCITSPTQRKIPAGLLSHGFFFVCVCQQLLKRGQWKANGCLVQADCSYSVFMLNLYLISQCPIK